MNDNMRYSDRLMRVIEILNLDSKQISKETGFSRSTVYSLVSGKPKKPSDGFLNAMADKFGVSTSWLMFGEGPIFLPGRYPITFLGNVKTDELKSFEMANFLIENLSLPPTCQGEVLELARKLVALKDDSPGEAAGEAEDNPPPLRKAETTPQNKSGKRQGKNCSDDTLLPGKTVRLRKRSSKHKAKSILLRQSIISKTTVKMKESEKVPTSLTEFILSEHDNILDVKNLKLVDCIILDIHRQVPQENTFLVESVCQFEFTGTLKKEKGMSEREFGVVVELSCCVLDQGRKFKSACILTQSVQFFNHEIFYAIDTELEKGRKKNVNVSGAAIMLEKKRQGIEESKTLGNTLIEEDEKGRMEELGDTHELVDTDEMIIFEAAFDTLYGNRKPTRADALA